MKCIAIGGVPATGKTTLMENIMYKLNPKKTFKFGLLRGYVVGDVYILGVYKKNDTFGGNFLWLCKKIMKNLLKRK